MSEPAPIIIEGINLEAFEKLVYTRDGSPLSFEAAAKELFLILGRVRRGSGFFGLENPEQQLPVLYTRLAGAVTALFADPKFNLSMDGFDRLCAEHTVLHSIFRASNYETMDHILAVIGSRNPANPSEMAFNGAGAMVALLLCWSLESEVEIDFERLYQAAPRLTAAAILGMLAIGGTHSERAYARRLKLMSLRHLVAQQPLPEALFLAAGDAYMHCSYTNAPDKHEIKAVMNKLLREHVLARVKVDECERPLTRKDRPTIVIPIEWFGSHHAMYRCYAPSMLQLKERFRMVALYRDSEIDAEGLAVFDKGIRLEGDQISFEAITKLVQAEEPDIMFYPSVGMAAWFVALSNFRMAPLQICCPGHPATTMSAVMDYMVTDGDLIGNVANYTERLVGMPVGSARYIPRREIILPAKPAPDGVVRLAVPAMATKLIPPFLATLKRIEAAAKNPVEFHFFPNMVGMSHWLMLKDLRRWFPKAVIHPRTGYQDYLENLVRCDMMLSSFPFGGTNSVIDCFLLGLPVVTLEGDSIHTRSDASMIRRVGLPEWLIAHTEDEYVAAALRAIEGDELRQESTWLTDVADVNKEFFGAGPEHVQGQFLEAFNTIYEEKLREQENSVS